MITANFETNPVKNHHGYYSIETNDLNYGGLIILIGGLVLAGFGINDFITARENKYIDSEKIKIVSRQVKPENGPLGKIKTK